MYKSFKIISIVILLMFSASIYFSCGNVNKTDSGNMNLSLQKSEALQKNISSDTAVYTLKVNAGGKYYQFDIIGRSFIKILNDVPLGKIAINVSVYNDGIAIASGSKYIDVKSGVINNCEIMLSPIFDFNVELTKSFYVGTDAQAITFGGTNNDFYVLADNYIKIYDKNIISDSSSPTPKNSYYLYNITPKGLAYDGSYLRIADYSSMKIKAYNPTNGYAYKNQDISLPYKPVGIAKTTGKYWIWSDQNSGILFDHYDTNVNLADSFATDNNFICSDLVETIPGSLYGQNYLISIGQDSMLFIDKTDGSILNSAKLSISDARGMAWDGDTLYVIDGKEGWVYKVSLTPKDASVTDLNRIESIDIFQQGLTALKQKDWTTAKSKFSQAKTADPNNLNAYLCYSVTNLALLVDEPSLQNLMKDIADTLASFGESFTVPSSADFLDSVNYSSPYYAIKYVTKYATSNSVKMSDVQYALYYTVLPHINSAINTINYILTNKPDYKFVITYSMTPDPYDHIRDNKNENEPFFTIGRPGLIALRGFLYGLKGVINYTCAYNLDLDSTDSEYLKNAIKDGSYASMPFGTLKSQTYMNDFKTALIKCINDVKSATTIVKNIRESIETTIQDKSLLDAHMFSDTLINETIEYCDTGLYYLNTDPNGQNYLKGNLAVDLDFDGVSEYLFPRFFWDYAIPDFKNFIPTNYFGLPEFTFSKSVFNFLFSNLSDNAFNRFKKFINIKHINKCYSYLDSEISVDFDEVDATSGSNNDITITPNFTSNSFTIQTALLRKIKLQSNIITSTVSTVDLTNATKSVTVDFSSDPQATSSGTGSRYNIKIFGFQTSSGKYGILRIVYMTNYDNTAFELFELNAYINSTGANSFWGRNLTESFTLYGKNSTDAYNDYLNFQSQIAKGKATPQDYGWTLINTYTPGSSSSITVSTGGNSYQYFLAVTNSDSYIIFKDNSYQNWYTSYSNDYSLIFCGSKKSNASTIYEAFQAEYITGNNDSNNQYYSYNPFQEKGFWPEDYVDAGIVFGFDTQKTSFTIYLLK